MKKFYKYLILLVLVGVSLPSYADWRFGLAAEYNNVSLNWKRNDVAYQANTVSGFTVGPVVAYEFIDYFSLQSGIYFAMGGYQLKDHSIYGDDFVDLKEDTQLYYLQLPIYAVGQLPIKKVENNLVLLLEAGPLFSYGIASNTTVTGTYKGESVTKKYNDIFQTSLSPFNCAIHLALGAEYAGARLLFGYNIGVFDFGRDVEYNNVITNGTFMVTAAYLF